MMPTLAKTPPSFKNKVVDKKALKNLVNRISQIKLEVDLIDAIIVSGDISDDGSIESYQLFNNILNSL